MVINLRGCNGSGKSWVARYFAQQGVAQYAQGSGRVREVHTLLPPQRGRPVGYEVPTLSLYVVGSYENECGGCDGIKTQDAVCSAVSHAAHNHDCVLFEGVVVSTIFQRYLDLSRDVQRNSGRKFVWAFLDTPLDVCLARVQNRNGGKPVKEDQIADKWNLMRRIADKATAAGERVEWINHLDPLSQIEALMAEEG